MTIEIEIPPRRPGVGMSTPPVAPLDDPPSEIDRWVVLDGFSLGGVLLDDVWIENARSDDHQTMRSLHEIAPELVRHRLDASSTPRLDSAATKPICDVLNAWRAAERELASLVEGRPDWDRVHAELVGLRALHHRLFEARMAAAAR
jgi:hypothetical protein